MSTFRHDPSQSTRRNNDDGSFSASSGSTYIPELRKLASVEISRYPDPVIDLTHVSNVHDLRPHVDDLKRPNSQRSLTKLHDWTGGNGSDHFAQFSSHSSGTGHSTSSFSSKDTGYYALPDLTAWSRSPRATFHRCEGSSTAKGMKVARSIDNLAPNDVTTVHHNSSTFLLAESKPVANIFTQKKEKGLSHAQKYHHLPQKIQSLAKPSRTHEVQEKTLLRSLFQCVNPSLPGDEDIPPQSRYQRAVLKALRSDDDALDGFFNTFERFSCEDEATLRRALGELRQVDKVRQEPRGIYDQPKIGGNTTNKLPIFNGRGNEATEEIVDDRDALDTVFEGVERFACRDDRNTCNLQYESNQRDALDRVFEGVDRLCHEDDIASQSLNIRTMSLLNSQDCSCVRAARGSPKLENHDMLEKFGRGFERALCAKPVARIGYEGDVLDRVFDKLERHNCRGDAFPHSDGGYYDTCEYDFEYDFSIQNSLAPSRDDESRELCKQVRFELPQKNSMRRPSKWNEQLHPPGKDMLDYVFENVEAGVCRNSNEQQLRRGILRNWTGPGDNVRLYNYR